MTDVPINPTFHIKVKHTDDDSPDFIEYRRKWTDNPKNFIVEDWPIHIDIETITMCNLRCYMCYYVATPPDPSRIEMDLFKKVVDEGSQKGVSSLKTQFRGEPLLDTRMPDMVAYAKNKGIIEVMFNSNGTLLTKQTAKALINAGLDKYICSMDGYTKDIYEEIRVGANFEQVLGNIKTLQELKKEMGVAKPTLRIQMVDTPKNHEQIDNFLEFWGNIAEQVAVLDMVDLESEEEDATPLPTWACSQIWQRLVVLTDGDVLPCCHALYGGREKRMVVGNAHHDKIEDIWKGSKMSELRELHMNGRSHEIKMCRNCAMRKGIVENKITRK